MAEASRLRRQAPRNNLCYLLIAMVAVSAVMPTAAASSAPADRDGGAAAVPTEWAAVRLHPAFRSAAALSELIQRLPKAELHIHIEGTLEVDLMFKLAAKNGVTLPYPNPEAARAARSNFTCLEDFLKLFVDVEVLQTEDDFHDLAAAYLARAHASGVVRAEMAFDPQGHTSRGVDFGAAYRGLARAMKDSPVDASLILTFERTRSEVEAAAALAAALPHLDGFVAVGLAGAEAGNPPGEFEHVYAAAPALGLHRVAHAGEEGGPSYVRDVLSLLGVDRVDHGIRALEDPSLVKAMAEAKVPITLCPVSNLRLKVYDGQLEARLREMLGSGIPVTINSDDPAYFGSYVNSNYEYVARIAGLGPDELAALAVNSFTASFLPKDRKDAYIAAVWKALDDWKRDHGMGLDEAQGQQQQQQKQVQQQQQEAVAWGRRAVPGWLQAVRHAAGSAAGAT